MGLHVQYLANALDLEDQDPICMCKWTHRYTITEGSDHLLLFYFDYFLIFLTPRHSKNHQDD